MTRRAKVEGESPVADKSIIPGFPGEAMDLESLIDERMKHVLCLAAEPKDLIKALEAASAWVKIRRDVKEPEWGGQLGRTIRNG